MYTLPWEGLFIEAEVTRVKATLIATLCPQKKKDCKDVKVFGIITIEGYFLSSH